MITRKDTGYVDDEDIPVWVGHRNIIFPSGQEMLKWINSNRETLELSDMIFKATLDCFKDNVDKLIVATLIAENVADVDIVTQKDSFNEMVSIYATKLLESENYEKLGEIKALTESAGLTFPNL